ncbi:hypothetical protein [Thalassomonas actiniarum]|uniref:Uncharacterized protein n=1 Tax=Thalassomonas actiniarum TaxID=485447 RepID=A0AAE9YWD0_9GAMM|nr:hypothetical protein [Thalassomonas actiniarum]WDE00773.1 hypothetical protein SG35_009135 [Thalassomonas actiniarum]
MKIKVLMTLLKTSLQRKTHKLNMTNQTLKEKQLSKSETAGNGEHCLDGYAAMGVLQLV